jgi:hypothetical protein
LDPATLISIDVMLRIRSPSYCPVVATHPAMIAMHLLSPPVIDTQPASHQSLPHTQRVTSHCHTPSESTSPCHTPSESTSHCHTPSEPPVIATHPASPPVIATHPESPYTYTSLNAAVYGPVHHR